MGKQKLFCGIRGTVRVKLHGETKIVLWYPRNCTCKVTWENKNCSVVSEELYV